MSIESNIFKKSNPDFKKLLEYGFKKTKDVYIFDKLFENGDFMAHVEIMTTGEVFGNVVDVESKDEFLPLKVESQEGAFVAGIREEYKNILADIRDKCFHKNYFASNQANRITDLIIKKYGDMPEFMWEQAPDFGVFRNPANNKWYGIIMNVPRLKLSGTDKTPVDILNVKLDKDEIPELLKNDGYYPAWHMNKKTWITIILDETLADDEIMSQIDKSHVYTISHKHKK